MLISKLKRDYPEFNFKPGKQEHWSPKTKTITYEPNNQAEQLNYGLLHELAHALLGHTNYRSDFELLKLESLAWQTAAEIGQKYGINIDDDHIQNCLDTYRDWLHRRSKCPVCGMHVMQQDVSTYKCFNCGANWHVSAGRFARSYRKKV
jgi:hypothetical protein